MTIGCGDLHSGNDEEIIDGEAIGTDQFLTGQILDRIASIVVGQGNATQPLVFGSRDLRLGGTDGIGRIVGMEVKIEGVKHREER